MFEPFQTNLAFMYLGSKGLTVHTMAPWIWVLVILAATIATFTDLRNMTIPNWLTLPLLVTGLLYSGITEGTAGIIESLQGCAVAGGIFMMAYIMIGGGGGDVKLMMALGSWLGFERSAVLMLAVTISGFFASIIILISQGSLKNIPHAIFHQMVMAQFGLKRLKQGKVINHDSEEIYADPAPRIKGWFPYAPAILVGTIGACWYWSRFGGVI
jgi:prepilin peptidase CpaA